MVVANHVYPHIQMFLETVVYKPFIIDHKLIIDVKFS